MSAAFIRVSFVGRHPHFSRGRTVGESALRMIPGFLFVHGVGMETYPG